MPTDYFAGEVAARYDGEDGMFAPQVVDATAAFLAELAWDGSALELGIGTGRIALPLARRGVRVAGIDLSQDMVAQLRAKPGGAELEIVIGDFATTRVEGAFSLVYLVFNTIGNLTTQAAQVACFENAARHLLPGGSFVVEVGVPQPGETYSVFSFAESHIGIDEYDAASQALVSHHFSRRGDHWELRSIPFRSVWPAELDLMARSAGLELVDRVAGWRREPFLAASSSHVSTWRKP